MTSIFASIKAALRGADGDGAPAPTATPPALVTSGGTGRRHSPSSVEDLELELLLEAIFQCYGYDYRGYLRELVADRVRSVMQQLDTPTISALQACVLHDAEAWDQLHRALYVKPALMFDDASEVALLRMSLGACLHGAALPRIWLADCAGAPQAWTLAILLDQEQLIARTEIYATVASDSLLIEAREASLPMARLAELQANYVRCGGTGQLLDYFEVNAEGTRAVPAARLRERITWAQYNLVTDASFNEFHMILGQRALPAFGTALRQRVLRLFDDSLAPFGVLALDRELDAHDRIGNHYRPLTTHLSWYQRRA